MVTPSSCTCGVFPVGSWGAETDSYAWLDAIKGMHDDLKTPVAGGNNRPLDVALLRVK